ncbi:MAG: rhomboid family intramembrane serine protease [Desulfosarcinaceae bacterium]|nr:rhomboid family intramembrane serine protease [Desulfosarcinaceae bacterium]
MLPLGDKNPTRRLALVNILLIAANVTIYLYQRFYAPAGAADFIQRFGFVPHLLSSLDQTGTAAAAWVPVTLVTGIFLHGGWFHLGSNMLFLWIFGDNVEDRLGHGRYLLFYLLCGILAALAHFCAHPGSTLPTIGASGAIAGVMGAYVFLFPKARIRTLVVVIIFIQIFHLPAWFLIGIWFVTQILSAATELATAQVAGIAWFAHIGGFVAGVLLLLALKPDSRT